MVRTMSLGSKARYKSPPQGNQDELLYLQSQQIIIVYQKLDGRKNDLIIIKKRFKMDEGWKNYRLFGTFSYKKINERNEKMIIE